MGSFGSADERRRGQAQFDTDDDLVFYCPDGAAREFSDR